jgi:RNA polymerase sigma-70 factor (ECF subfamily)
MEPGTRTALAAAALAEVVGVSAVPAPPPDEAAFRALYDATARPIWAYLYRTLGNGADADDLVQEVFLRYLKRPLDTRDPAENRAYLFRIAGNLAIDHWRQGSRRDARTGDAAEAARATAPDQAEAVALRADMARTFRELNPRERTLLWLSCVEGESPAAIAEALGVGRNSVPVLLFRARKKLARLLRRAGWEG